MTLNINTGVLTGTPLVGADATTAIITVTDGQGSTASIEIAIGEITDV